MKNGASLMKGQRCSNEVFVSVVWHYAHLSPPQHATAATGLSRQSVGKIYRKIGRRARKLIPASVMERLYIEATEFGFSEWIEPNKMHIGNFGDIFFDGFTREYFSHMRLTANRTPLYYLPMWQMVQAMNNLWGGLSRKSFFDHIGIAIYRAAIVAQLHAMHEYAVANNEVNKFLEVQKLFHPDVPSDFDEMIKFDNISTIVAGTLLEQFRVDLLD